MMHLKVIVTILLYFSASLSHTSGDPSRNANMGHGVTVVKPVISERSITIVVMGRNGSDIGSTIRELIGHKTTCATLELEEKNTLEGVFEYTISDIPSESGNIYKLKLVELPGFFLDPHTMGQDAQALATLKSYIAASGPPGPSFFLVLSRFDDNRILGKQSLFLQLVHRMSLFKDVFVDRVIPKKIPLIFLLTHFMRETKVMQRQPEEKIDIFRRAIHEEYSNLSSFVSFVVGENEAGTEYGLKLENGYYKLRNRELYPKNVWQALKNATNPTDSELLELLTSLMENREVKMTCEVKSVKTNWDNYEEDQIAFEYLMKTKNVTVEDSDVNWAIDLLFNTQCKSPHSKVEEMVQKTTLQLYLQNENIVSKSDFPKESEEKTEFFQKSSLVSGTIPALILEETFKIKMPDYTDALSVGFGYDVLADDQSSNTPFKIGKYLPSSIGFQVPHFMKCRRLPGQEVKDFMFYAGNITKYFSQRLEQLDFEVKENVSLKHFSGKVKEGYNVPPLVGSSFVTLSGLKEIRTVECKLKEPKYWKLSEEFVAAVAELTWLNSSDKDSVRTWKHFFAEYGSHIISRGFGGGSFIGWIVESKLVDKIKSEKEVNATLKSIMKFRPFSDPTIVPLYSFWGGKRPNKMNSRDKLPGEPIEMATWQEKLKNWRDSLSSKFVMLVNELSLEPISSVVMEKIGQEEGEMIKEAISMYLKGELNVSPENIETEIPSSPPTTIENQISSESDKKVQKISEKFQRRLDVIKAQGKEDDKQFQDQINALRLANQMEEERHRIRLKLLEKRRMEEERRQRMKQCSWFNGWCLS